MWFGSTRYLAFPRFTKFGSLARLLAYQCHTMQELHFSGADDFASSWLLQKQQRDTMCHIQKWCTLHFSEKWISSYERERCGKDWGRVWWMIDWQISVSRAQKGQLPQAICDRHWDVEDKLVERLETLTFTLLFGVEKCEILIKFWGLNFIFILICQKLLYF